MSRAQPLPDTPHGRLPCAAARSEATAGGDVAGGAS